MKPFLASIWALIFIMLLAFGCFSLVAVVAIVFLVIRSSRK